MFHVEHLLAAARFSNLDLDEMQLELLDRYGEWLAAEGTVAGGLGPGEIGRIELRHLADSLLFASKFPIEVTSVWDLGSGVGLPGVPLAIAFPNAEFRLIDRAGRRAQLMRRVIRILDLQNCQVVQGEIQQLQGEAPLIVSRASLSPTELEPLLGRLLAPGGRAIVAGSWKQAPQYPGWETVEIPPDVLDQPVWLLIMRRE